MWTEKKLENLLTTPSQGLIDDITKIEGDILILGAGGKMGPTLAILAKNACKAAGINKRIIAVSRFSNKDVISRLKACGVDVIAVDLMEEGNLELLPDVQNIIFMAGKKFGTNGNEWETWAMNASLPTLVCRRFKKANIIVFSTGNIYPQVPITSGGCTEEVKPMPIGEYSMSALARERIFEFAAKKYGSKVLFFRLNYAIDLRYGVLYDLASKILENEPINLGTSNFNCVWQGYANEIAIRSLLHVDSPARILNVTGPETVSVRYAATFLGKYLGKEPVFEGIEGDKAYLSNAGLCFKLFGYPSITLNHMMQWQAEWILNGGKTLNLPTHFDERRGNF